MALFTYTDPLTKMIFDVESESELTLAQQEDLFAQYRQPEPEAQSTGLEMPTSSLGLQTPEASPIAEPEPVGMEPVSTPDAIPQIKPSAPQPVADAPTPFLPQEEVFPVEGPQEAKFGESMDVDTVRRQLMNLIQDETQPEQLRRDSLKILEDINRAMPTPQEEYVEPEKASILGTAMRMAGNLLGQVGGVASYIGQLGETGAGMVEDVSTRLFAGVDPETRKLAEQFNQVQYANLDKIDEDFRKKAEGVEDPEILKKLGEERVRNFAQTREANARQYAAALGKSSEEIEALIQALPKLPPPERYQQTFAEDIARNPISQLSKRILEEYPSPEEVFGGGIVETFKDNPINGLAYMGLAGLEQAGNMLLFAVNPTVGLATVGLGAAGQKVEELHEKDISDGMKLLAGAGYGAAEAIPEMFGSAAIVGRLKDSIIRGAKEVGEDAAKRAAKDLVEEAAKKFLKGWGTEFVEENVTSLSQMIVDAATGAEDPEALKQRLSNYLTKEMPELAGATWIGGAAEAAGEIAPEAMQVGADIAARGVEAVQQVPGEIAARVTELGKRIGKATKALGTATDEFQQSEAHDYLKQLADERTGETDNISDVLRVDSRIAKVMEDAKTAGAFTEQEANMVEQNMGQLRDAVFGLQGRKANDEALSGLVRLYQEGKLDNFSVGMIDIQNLGEMNSVVGHEAANELLREIKPLIDKHLQPLVQGEADIELYKQGGDEIGVLAPNVDRATLESALDAADAEIRTWVENKVVKNKKGEDVRLAEFSHPKHDRLVTGAGAINAGVTDATDIDVAIAEMEANAKTDDSVNLEDITPERALLRLADRNSYIKVDKRLRKKIAETVDKPGEFVYDRNAGVARKLGSVAEELAEQWEAEGKITEDITRAELKEMVKDYLDTNKDTQYERIQQDTTGDTGEVGQVSARERAAEPAEPTETVQPAEAEVAEVDAAEPAVVEDVTVKEEVTLLPEKTEVPTKPKSEKKAPEKVQPPVEEAEDVEGESTAEKEFTKEKFKNQKGAIPASWLNPKEWSDRFKKTYKGFLKGHGKVDPIIFDAKIRKEGEVQAKIKEAAFKVADLDRAIRDSDPELVPAINKSLTEKTPISELPKELQPVVSKIRRILADPKKDVQVKIDDILDFEKPVKELPTAIQGEAASLRKLALSTKSKLIKDVDKYLKEKDPKKKQEMFAKLPEAVQPVAADMRNHVDAMTREIIDQGLVDTELAQRLEENIGSYLTRSYQVFDDPNWAKKVDPKVMAKAKAFITREMTDTWMDVEEKANDALSKAMELESTVRNPELTEPKIKEINKRIDSLRKRADKFAEMSSEFEPTEENVRLYIKDLLNKEGAPMRYLSSGVLGSKNLSILKKRKDIPPEIRALWGEYDDPRVNYMKSIARMGQMVANDRFLKRVKEEGLGKIFFKKRTEKDGIDYYTNIAKTNKAMEPLGELYTSDDVVEVFNQMEKHAPVEGLMKLYMKGISLTKAGKTIYSPSTHVRNVLANLLFVSSAGHWDISKAKQTAKAVLAEMKSEGTTETREFITKLKGLGVIGESVGVGELRDMMKDIQADGFENVFDNRLVKTGKKFAKGAEKAYAAEDDVFKIFAFLNERDIYKKAYPDKTEIEIDEIAAKNVRNLYPTYSMVPEAIKQLRKFPALGTFVSFPAEVVRVTGNTVDLINEEWKSGNPVLKKQAAKRATGALVSASLPIALGVASRMWSGISKQEEDDYRESMPPWSKNSQLMWLWKDKNNHPMYVDLGAHNPYAYLATPVMAWMGGKDYKLSVLDAGAEALMPFLGWDIFTQAALETIMGETMEGKQVWNKNDSWDDIAKGIGGHLGKAITPTAITQAKRVYDSFMDAPATSIYRSKRNPAIELAAAGGLRISSIDPKKSLFFRAAEFNREQQAIKSARYDDPIEEEVTALVLSLKDFQDQVSADKRLGIKNSEISTILKNAGIPAYLRKMLINEVADDVIYKRLLAQRKKSRQKSGQRKEKKEKQLKQVGF